MCVEVRGGDMHPCPPVCVRFLLKFKDSKNHFSVMLKSFSLCFLTTKFIGKKIGKIVEDSRFGNNAIRQ